MMRLVDEEVDRLAVVLPLDVAISIAIAKIMDHHDPRGVEDDKAA